MKTTLTAVALGLLLATGVAFAAAPPANVTAALADAGRTDADRTADALRKPADMIAFADIKAGTVIAELAPGGGYFSRIFTKVVGPSGKVFAINGPANPARPSALAPLAAAPGSNLVLVDGPLETFKTTQPVDVVWTSRNYHDWTPANRALINKAAFDALKPGGIYIVLDHAAVSGSGANTLHRMDETLARTELAAAGFQFVSASDVLRNPADDRTKAVFDGDVRSKTDQFVLKYRKP